MTGGWGWVISLTGAASLASSIGALALSTLGGQRLARLLPTLVSFSAGVMLGAACLDLLPEAFTDASAGRASNLGLTLALGILGFFVLEKLIHVHHSHDVDADAHHAQDHATTVMVLMGTSLHNVLAGILLAAAVLVDVRSALILFAAILAHHIPQQVGDFSVLLMTGFNRARALVLTFCSSAAILVGGVIAFVVLQHADAVLPFVLVLAAASLIYVALADLVPRLRAGRGQSLFVGVVMVAGGIGVIYVVVRLLPG